MATAGCGRHKARPKRRRTNAVRYRLGARIIVLLFLSLGLLGCANYAWKVRQGDAEYEGAVLVPDDMPSRRLYHEARHVFPEQLRRAAGCTVRGFSPVEGVRIELAQPGEMYWLVWLWRDRDGRSYFLTNGIDIHNPSDEMYYVAACPADEAGSLLATAAGLMRREPRAPPGDYLYVCDPGIYHITVWSGRAKCTYVIYQVFLTLGGERPLWSFPDEELTEFQRAADLLVDGMFALPERFPAR